MSHDTEAHQRRLNYEATKRYEVDLDDLKMRKRQGAVIQALATQRRGEEISALTAGLGPAAQRAIGTLVREALYEAFDSGVEARRQRELKKGRP